jgi:PAS domain S-box-containing protein
MKPARKDAVPPDTESLRRELDELRALVAELREREAAARDTEQRLRAVVQSAPIVLFAMDAEGRFTLSEGKGLAALGLKPGEVVGLSAFDVYRDTPQIIENLRACLKGEVVNDVVHVGDHAFEALYSPRRDAAGKVEGVDGLAWDVTERFRAEATARRFETQLLQAQKIETIGTLAGGIAHDFNNILSPILGYTDIAMDLLEKGHPAREDLQQVLNAAGRARELVHQILIFARGGDQQKRPVQLHLVVQEALKLIRATLPTTIEISQRIANRGDTVLADPGQMHQVIMNLCTNAAHAMRANGGTLRVTLERQTVDSEEAPAISGIMPGTYVVLTVEDTGEGMPEAILARVFEPFFTTKPSGEGTGLGLSVVHGIVHSHGGTITAESRPGAGSVFRVFLPAVVTETSARPAGPEAGGTVHGEHVLVVDDEPEIVRMLSRMLESRGYRVTAFSSSEQALGEFRRSPSAFDAIITDQTMPRITGVALARAVREIRPDLPVIITTGYGEKVTSESLARDVAGFAAKPFDAATLTATLRRVLDAARSGS